MVSAIATRKPDPAWPRFRVFAFSRLAQIILAANGLALLVLIIGMLAVSESRRGLVEAKLDSLRAEGQLIANILAESAAISDPSPELIDEDARAILRQLYVPEDVRVRIFGRDGEVVADSHLLASRFDVRDLPPPGEGGPGFARSARSLMSRALDGFTGLFRTYEERVALERKPHQDVEDAMLGITSTGVRRQDNGARFVSVTIPIQPVRAVVGAVMLESFDLDALIQSERRALFPFIFMAILVSILSSLLLTIFIARPIRRLAEAAHAARRASGKRVRMPALRGRRDEIGELGRALSAMTEAIYDRMDTIERFAADVAHELKNPLTSIRSAAEVLPKAKDEERRNKLLAVIASDVNRLDRLITDISKASRLDAELARETVERIELSELLGDIVEGYRAARTDGPDIRFETKARETAIDGRAGAIGQVFRNLIDNAITFSPDRDGASVRLSLRRDHADGQPVLIAAVEDDGPGLPPDNLETVFERFYTERPKGAAFGTHSGLGLAIARQIITAHGGRIHAENRTGPDGMTQGARFVVRLPAAGPLA